MPVSINWATKVINIPVDFLTPLGGVFYELDVNAFRLALKDIEDGEGMPYLDTHRHNTEVTLGGATYARTFEIINGYTVNFDDTIVDHYTVRCVGANHNVADVKIPNSISLIVGNSAGLVVSGGTADPAAIATAVWNKSTVAPAAGTYGAFVQKLLTVAKFLGLK